MKPLFTGSHADAAPPPAAPPRAAPGLARLALICDPAHHSSGPTLLLEIHDPRDRVPPHRHVHAVEMFFVLRGRVARGGGPARFRAQNWQDSASKKEKPGQSASILLLNYPFRTEMFATRASAECAGFGGIVLTGIFTRHRRR